MPFKFKVFISSEATVEAKNLDEARGVVIGAVQSKLPGWNIEQIKFNGKVLPAPKENRK